MTGTLVGCSSIWQLLDEPAGDVVDAIAMDVHSDQFLLTSIYIKSDSNNNSDSISFFLMKVAAHQ